MKIAADVPRITRLQLDLSRSQRNRACSASSRTNGQNIVLACFALWLARVTDTPIVTLQTTFPDGPPEDQHTVGWLSNTQLLGLDLAAENTTFRLIACVRMGLQRPRAIRRCPRLVYRIISALSNRIVRAPARADLAALLQLHFCDWGFLSAMSCGPTETSPAIPRLPTSAGLCFTAADHELGLLITISCSFDRFRAEEIESMMNVLRATLCWVERFQKPDSQSQTAGLHV